MEEILSCCGGGFLFLHPTYHAKMKEIYTHPTQCKLDRMDRKIEGFANDIN